MIRLTDRSPSIAGIVVDAVAMAEAALEENFDEARLCALRIAKSALELHLQILALTATEVIVTLGPSKSRPSGDYGDAVLKLADEINMIVHAGSMHSISGHAM